MRYVLSLFLAWLWGTTAWAAHRTHNVYLDVECQHAGHCSLYLTRQLEVKYGCKFMAEVETDTVCGALQITHCDVNSPGLAHDPVCQDVKAHNANHLVQVILYDTEELPTARRKSHLKPPVTMPTAAQVEVDVKKVPKPWTRMVGFETRMPRQIACEVGLASAEAKLMAAQPLTAAEVKAMRECR